MKSDFMIPSPVSSVFDLDIHTEKEEEDEEIDDSNQSKDPFNISNDEYYNPKIATDTALRTNLGGTLYSHYRVL